MPTGAGPLVVAYNRTGLSNGTPSSWNAITWDTNAFDTSDGGMHSETVNTSRYVAPSTGYYMAQCSLIMAGGSPFFQKMKLNGGDDVLGSGSGISAGNNSSVSTVILSMTEGDYIEAYYNPGGPDHPASGTTWVGACFQFIKLFSLSGGSIFRPQASMSSAIPRAELG